MATAFDAHRGSTQGRLEVSDAPDGDYVYELGRAGGRSQDLIAVGDYSQIYQTFTPDPNDAAIRCTVKVIEPTAEDTVAWEIIGYVNGVEMYKRRLEPLGRSLTLTNVVLSLIGPSPPYTVALRLAAVTP